MAFTRHNECYDFIEDLGIFPLNLEKLTSQEPDLIILTEAWRDGEGMRHLAKLPPQWSFRIMPKAWPTSFECSTETVLYL
ncbi:hypothetical protein GCM10008018_43390 [Paenibacillus marchantiophytorum]|uniref:Fe/B12 periplasmic-binding domain-containing protein n=1 Tax=Paenibacillus marchantiophytorum TaxID=1619310 RepID=A0ABQ1EXT8_9BACL|nr:hypothetical protein GCM10008018_43390 [Paenibacillus marchantiophytorum]